MFLDSLSALGANHGNCDDADAFGCTNSPGHGARARLSICAALCAGLWLAAGPGTVGAQVRPQPAPPIEAAPVLSAPIRLQGPDDPAASRDIQRLKAQANAPGRGASAKKDAGPAPKTTASAGAARAAWLLGLIYLHGSGVARDPVQAALWFERAQLLGETAASAGLAWCQIEGCKGSPDPAGARRWIAQLRASHPAKADFLEWLAESRLSPVQLSAPQLGPSGPDAAVPAPALLLSAAQKGDVNARIELGVQQVAAGRLAEAQAYFRAASPLSAAAAANLAWVSSQLEKEATGAPATLPADALLASAQRFHRGEGQPANFTEAIRLYRLADRNGSAQARQMLALIFSRPTPSGGLDVQWMQELSQLNLSRNGPGFGTASAGQTLRREPSPLFSLLPQVWRDRTMAIGR